MSAYRRTANNEKGGNFSPPMALDDPKPPLARRGVATGTRHFDSVRRSILMCWLETTREVRPDDEQFGRIPCLIRARRRCAHFLRSSAFNREGSALSKAPKWRNLASKSRRIRRIPDKMYPDSGASPWPSLANRAKFRQNLVRYRGSVRVMSAISLESAHEKAT
jgi:hypothetical protein